MLPRRAKGIDKDQKIANPYHTIAIQIEPRVIPRIVLIQAELIDKEWLMDESIHRCTQMDADKRRII